MSRYFSAIEGKKNNKYEPETKEGQGSPENREGASQLKNRRQVGMEVEGSSASFEGVERGLNERKRVFEEFCRGETRKAIRFFRGN